LVQHGQPRKSLAVFDFSTPLEGDPQMKHSVAIRHVLVAAALSASVGVASAQGNAALDGIAKYREMLQDGNPADLFEMKGEELWKQKRGPKNASMEQCDLGKGPGVVKGAFVELPRFFKDTGKVMDLETRLIHCMVTLQGFNEADLYKAAPSIGKGEGANLVAMTTYVSATSKGMRFNLPNSTEQEKTMYEVGKRLFFQRGGPHDFACSTCHSTDGGRIRLQDLPNLTKNPGDGVGVAAWPAYRVSNSQMWTMQKRLNDCYRQQRFPEPKFGSDATIALGVYMGVNAKGAESIVPAIKR
jgi:sulfur-oxidizing protein SoxA